MTYTYVLWFALIMILAAVSLARWANNSNKRYDEAHAKERAEHQRQLAFLRRVDQLTPNDKPLFFYNRLQNTWAFTSYYRMIDKHSERIEIATSGGDKILANRTASITLRGDDDALLSIFDHLIMMALGCERNDLFVHDRHFFYDFIKEARGRMFRECEDLYVQIGTKVPPSTTRAEIERLNTRCYTPAEVWEALEADITEYVQSRIQAG